MTPRGSAIWVALAALLAAGFFESVLARCRLRRGAAAAWCLAVGAGSLAGVGGVNLGGGLAAALWAALLLCRGARDEIGRALTAAAGGATVLYALVPGPWLVPIASATPLGAGVAAGVAVHLIGGSDRAPLAGALLAAPLAGAAGWATARALGMPDAALIGGGGAFDAQAVAVVVAAALGEASARLRRPRPAGGPRDGVPPPDGPEEAGGGLH